MPASMESIGIGTMSSNATGPALAASAVYPVANTAYFVPFATAEPLTVVKLFAQNGATVSGNIDVGIYAVDGTRLVSSGSTGQTPTATVQIFDIADTLIGPGQVFYLAIAMDNTTGTLFRISIGVNTGSILGMAEMASAFPLPATATLATLVNGYLPTFGLTGRVLV
jgi:hypothetical protein